MKGKIAKHREQFAALPEPLQRQILFRLGFSPLFFLLFILVLYMMYDWLTVIPFAGLSIFSLTAAYILFRRSITGGYVVIRGTCIDSEVTLVRKRTKSVLVETEEHMVRVMLKQRMKRILAGAALDIYVASNTQVYDKDGVKLLHTYLAIDVKGGIKRDKGNRPLPETEND